MPLLVYTDKGWEIERETVVEELLNGFDQLLDASVKAYDMEYLKDRNRGMIMMLLDRVEASGNRMYLPILEAWAQVDYMKVRRRIREVIAALESNEKNTN